jgi:murein DD-endopeptidase MepM/ murein hydrolase activator NlpD
MAKNRYYYYDDEACSFVELKSRRRRIRLQATAVGVVTLALAMFLTWSLDQVVATPQELALKAENEALQREIEDFGGRLNMLTGELDQLAERDQDLYRSLLQAEPIPDDIRQVGTGGSDAYSGFDGLSPNAASLLRETSGTLDRLELQLGLQRDSYQELSMLAGRHERHLEQLPAILPSNGRVVSGFGMRDHPILKVRRPHYGLDIIAPRGTPVVVAGDGVVLDVSRSSSFGNIVKVEHADAGYVTYYAHLNGFAKGLHKGQKVKRGEVIAYVGNTGLSASPHLHYEVRDLDGRALNPVRFFAPSMTPAAYQELVEASESSTISFD